ncbi:ABC-type uncharacterized transport system ATPase subunit [Desulfitispora alkaliphila]
MKIGYLPEERGLYKEARVLDILIFLAGLKGISKVEELSKGMAQKVQFIAAVLHNPALVVLKGDQHL